MVTLEKSLNSIQITIKHLAHLFKLFIVMVGDCSRIWLVLLVELALPPQLLMVTLFRSVLLLLLLSLLLLQPYEGIEACSLLSTRARAPAYTIHPSPKQKKKT